MLMLYFLALVIQQYHFLTYIKKCEVQKTEDTPTDEEQDILRAMLIFSSAGLDSMVKQLIRDALPEIIRKSEGAFEMFKTHIERKMKRGDQ